MASNTDQRKEQIRNSNREAARRCRERRRNYIETLEAKLRNMETKQEALVVSFFYSLYSKIVFLFREEHFDFFKCLCFIIKAENASLQKEIHNLKRLLYDHKDCNLNGLNKIFASKNEANTNLASKK